MTEIKLYCERFKVATKMKTSRTFQIDIFETDEELIYKASKTSEYVKMAFSFMEPLDVVFDVLLELETSCPEELNKFGRKIKIK